MKKIFLTLIMSLMLVCSFAQNRTYFTATSYAVADVTYGVYTWSDWVRCDVTIVFDNQNDVVYIYSNSPQRYTLTTDGVESYDNSGGHQVSFKVVDQDGDRGTMRLRVERNGNSQIYVDFNNVAWVYNLRRSY